MRAYVERVQAWIDSAGGLPLINNPLLDEVDDEAAQTRTEFWEPSSIGGSDSADEFFGLVPDHDPTDPAQRFVVLSWLWMIREDGKYAYLHPEHLEERRRSIDHYLRTAVDQLAPTDCRNSVHVRWEMIVAAELGLWQRVDSLYQHWRNAWPAESTEAALSTARIKLIPSIFDTASELWTISWWLEYPYDLPEPARLGTQLIRESCAMIGGPPAKRLKRWTPVVVNEESLERVREAAELFGRTERLGGSLDVPSQFLRGWAHTVIGIATGSVDAFRSAAAVYEPLLPLVGPGDDGSLTKKAHLLLTLARLQFWAGASQEAQDWAELLVCETPDEPFCWEIVAQLRRARGDDAGWVQAYEEYVRRSSHLDADWSTTEFLRLALAQATGSLMVRIVEAVPPLKDDLEVTRAAVALLWPRFEVLAPVAQSRIVHGIAFLTNPRIVSALGDARWPQAVSELGEAINEHLRASIVRPFSAWLRQNHHFDALRGRLQRGDDEANLVSALKSPDRITLGQVANLFGRGATGQGVVAPLFLVWLDQKAPELRSALSGLSEKLERLTKARNAAIHQSLADRATAEQTQKDVKAILEILSRPSASGPS